MDFHSQSETSALHEHGKADRADLLATHFAINEGDHGVVTAQESDVHGPDGMGRH
jgi:hypothetical protein